METQNGTQTGSDHVRDSIDEDKLFRRKELSIALGDAGFPIAEATLATRAVRGGGPPFHRFGRTPLYRWKDALDWARASLGPAQWTTSEGDPVAKRATRARLLPELRATDTTGSK